MNSLDKAEKTMLDNLFKNTGKTIEQWIDIVKKQKFEKHGEIINFLKDKYTLTYGYANLVAHKSKGSDAGSVENKNDLIEKQYKGKEHFKPSEANFSGLLTITLHLVPELRKFAVD